MKEFEQLLKFVIHISMIDNFLVLKGVSIFHLHIHEICRLVLSTWSASYIHLYERLNKQRYLCGKKTEQGLDGPVLQRNVESWQKQSDHYLCGSNHDGVFSL